MLVKYQYLIQHFKVVQIQEIRKIMDEIDINMIATYCFRCKLGYFMPRVVNKRVRPPALLMHYPCEVPIIIIERCRRPTREALNSAECRILYGYLNRERERHRQINLNGLIERTLQETREAYFRY